MKLTNVQHPNRSHPITDTIADLWVQWQHQKLPRYLLLGLCLNLALAPAVYAATGGDFTRSQAYWIAALGLVTIALSIYLFVVMFAPERF